MLDRTATAWLRRLLTWLEPFEDCFGRQSQRGALRRYITALLNDSRRKSMEAMWARLSDPGTYQAFQHFITHAPWQADGLWKRLRRAVPERRGVLILDGTSFPKHMLVENLIQSRVERMGGTARQILGRHPHRALLRVSPSFAHRHRRQCSTRDRSCRSLIQAFTIDGARIL